uniref:Uncharacterized protein n=1 Tax=Anguilla anguilla TaxID=7936 RepID=A0A0E9P7R0_ANGAN
MQPAHSDWLFVESCSPRCSLSEILTLVRESG